MRENKDFLSKKLNELGSKAEELEHLLHEKVKLLAETQQ
jgi:hypothetical protein